MQPKCISSKTKVIRKTYYWLLSSFELDFIYNSDLPSSFLSCAQAKMGIIQILHTVLIIPAICTITCPTKLHGACHVDELSPGLL